jgi:hypothetical protein
MVRLVSRKGPRDLRPGSGPALRRSQGGVGLAEQAVPDRSDRVAIGFWAALDPTERDAFRSASGIAAPTPYRRENWRVVPPVTSFLLWCG